MEYIKKEDLIENEIYKASNESLTFIMKATKDLNDVINIPSYNEFMKSGNFNGRYLTFINATPEEKYWLNECIKLDKFTTFNEAMKTFVPEYFECTDLYGWKQTIRENNGNLIFKSDFKSTCSCQIIDSLKDKNSIFKPSTKEAYDAQFVVKEPESLPQFKIIESVETITKVENNEGNQFFIGDIVKSSNGTIQTIKSFDYNKNKTNIIAFTNKQSILDNGIGIDKIEHYIETKPVIEETLLEKAKRLYPIGTKFKSVYSGKVFTIKNHIQETPKNLTSIIFGTNEPNNGNMFYACIHTNNKWAEIIK